MPVILVAMVTGCFIGCFLKRLASHIICFIHEKEVRPEIGAITYSLARRPFFAKKQPENGVTGLWGRYRPSFFKDRFNREFSIGRTTPFVLISSAVSGVAVWYFGVTFEGLSTLLCLYFLILLGLIDLKTGYLPDCLVYPFLWAGLLVNIKSLFVPIHMAVISTVSAYLLCRMANMVFKSVTGKDGMGKGDFKMIAALGAWFGWMSLLIIVIIASFLAITTGLTRIFSGRARYEEYIPFGPYLAIATLPILLYGNILKQTMNDFF